MEAILSMIRTEMVNAEYAVAVTGDNFSEMFAGRIYDDRYIPGLENLANAAKKNGSVCMVQLLNNGLELMRENRIADISRKALLR